MKTIELINASAGSGKTYTLAEIVLRNVKDGLDPQRLMATTFTNKAAAELRERLRRKLLQGERTDEAQLLLGGLIGTVNSVCAHLLREYSLEAGLSPAIEILPEEEGVRQFKMAVARVVDRHEPMLEPVASRLGHDGGMEGQISRPDWQTDVQSVVDLARANAMTAADLRAFASVSWSSFKQLLPEPIDLDLDNLLLAAVNNALDDFSSVADPGGESEKTIKHLKEYQAGRELGRSIRWAQRIPLAKAKVTKHDGVDIEDVRTIAGQVMQHPGFHADMQAFIEGVFGCAGEALEEYERYKREHGLMDYVDQEEKVLQIASEHPDFRAAMQERLELVMIDEFQDTSPIQLALFLRLHELSGRSTWVGDPKQSIFNFRGADPQLMEEAAKRVTPGGILPYSWRSREPLVTFANEVFTRAFHWMPAEHVRLTIPTIRKGKAEGGWLEQWQLRSGNNDTDSVCIAAGIRDILERRSLRPADISVLCRTNDQCALIAAALEVIGIRASVPHGELLATREVQLTLAGMRYLQDRHDSLALAEIVHLSPLHHAHEDWLASSTRAPELIETDWRSNPLVEALDGLRTRLHRHTPMELLEATIDALRIPEIIAAWSRAGLRSSNLDALRGACSRYCDRCRSRGTAATIGGYIAYLSEAKEKQASGSGDDTVQVLTYHKAKGLEWPVVVLTSLGDDLTARATALGVNIVAAKEFDPEQPLAGRSIRFWPKWYFGNRKFEPFIERISGSVEEQSAKEVGLREAQRLMYVGITRARDGLVFAMRKSVKNDGAGLETKWLDQLIDAAGVPAISWPTDPGPQTLHFGDIPIPVHGYEYDAENTDTTTEAVPDSQYRMPRVDDVVEYPRARISPSSLASEPSEHVVVEEIAALGDRITLGSNPDMQRVGSAIHAFLAADDATRDHTWRMSLAASILANWEVESVLTPESLLEINDRLMEFINDRWPDATIRKEWPVSLRTENGVVMQGWVDMLVESREGIVIIDHKSFPGTNEKQEMQKYFAQLSLYSRSLGFADEAKATSTLLHLPLRGRLYVLHTDS